MGDVVPFRRKQPCDLPDATAAAASIRETLGWHKSRHKSAPDRGEAGHQDVCTCTTERDSVEQCHMHGVKYGGRAVPAYVTQRRARQIRMEGPANVLGNLPIMQTASVPEPPRGPGGMEPLFT